ncbi:uncharacterized protein LOC117731194 [Cyclopterus lumpus]|uniref:uncharacterized protein LOC117731194 n=1 Tax=Cyclopterus lumpus TaxID=8103 RepID=UPI001487432E|nr:uncharacterized protein LOC117731194 [Cyclopterus lumpus]
MKPLCVAAVVVLSLTSVCQAASLACEKMLKPVDKGPDIRGIWYLIAISSEECWVSTLFNSVLWPSVEMNITSKDTSKIHSAEFKFKIYGYCHIEREHYLYENNTLSDVNINTDEAEGEPDVLLQSGCPDCIVIKERNNVVFLISRRKTVTDAELKEFESQVACLGWSKPEVTNSDYDYENCLSFDDDGDTSGLSSLILKRLRNTYIEAFKCFMVTLFSQPGTMFALAKETWSDMW